MSEQRTIYLLKTFQGATRAFSYRSTAEVAGLRSGVSYQITPIVLDPDDEIDATKGDSPEIESGTEPDINDPEFGPQHLADRWG